MGPQSQFQDSTGGLHPLVELLESRDDSVEFGNIVDAEAQTGVLRQEIGERRLERFLSISLKKPSTQSDGVVGIAPGRTATASMLFPLGSHFLNLESSIFRTRCRSCEDQSG